MKVRLFCDDEQGTERFWRVADLRDCFDDDDTEAYEQARAEIARNGRVWIGGAGPMAYLAMRA